MTSQTQNSLCQYIFYMDKGLLDYLMEKQLLSYVDEDQLRRDAKRESILLEYITNRWKNKYSASRKL